MTDPVQKTTACTCWGGSTYGTDDPGIRRCDICHGIVLSDPLTGEHVAAMCNPDLLDLRCDAPGCVDPVAVRVGAEQRCYRHAMERGNEMRRAAGLPPVTLDETGAPHVCQ